VVAAQTLWVELMVVAVAAAPMVLVDSRAVVVAVPVALLVWLLWSIEHEIRTFYRQHSR
jgi:hypothetical protein